MKNQILCSAALCVLSAFSVFPLSGASKPNVVVILSDDQSYTDYGFMGHDSIETPHLDRLASESALFRRGYVPTALCRPALMTIATGLYSHQNRTTGNDPAATRANLAHSEKRGEPARELLISHIDETGALPQWLAKAGYVSHQSGKWWEGNFSRGGFTEGMTRGYPEKGGRHGDDGLKIGREGMNPVFDFIDGSVVDEKPFFLWYAPFMPHTPHTPPKALFEKYKAQGHSNSTAKYYAMCEWFDQTIGELLDHIDAKGIAEDTLVIYVTDNGWVQDPDGNGYLARSKRSPNEGGTRTPIFFRWPGTIAPADRPELCSSIDIVPTILAATGAEGPHDFPGLNLLPAIRDGEEIQRNTIFGESFAHDIADIDKPEESLLFRWVIEGDMKLLLTYDGRQGKMKYRPADFRPQLYNLKKDPGEERNLASTEPKIVKRLAALLDAWWPVKERKTVLKWSDAPVVLSTADEGEVPTSPKEKKRKKKTASAQVTIADVPLTAAAPKSASPAPKAAAPAKPDPLDPKNITTLPGFAIEHLYTVPKETQGSWVSLTAGPGGRLYASDQGDKGLFEITVGEGGAVKVEPVSVKAKNEAKALSGAQGLLWAYDSLWFHRNGGYLYRLSDSDGDGRLDGVETMPSENGGGEHGNHGLILTEDAKAIYMDGGNHAPLAELAGKRLQSWDEDLLLPRMWDARGHARGRLAPGGWVTRFNPETKTQELYCSGFRNEYDIALNRFGDMFTFDADMEWDMGMPWYRPTRICHVVSGGDYGWRSGSGKWPVYYEDSLPPVVEIGPGSPTGVVAGIGAKFPAKYQDAIYALDWTFGTIYAIHLTPDGAGYRGESEPFVYGSPLPVTDAVIGADGALYFLVGGRGTQSALFRVRYTGDESTKPIAELGSVQEESAAEARELRRQLERYHGNEDEAAIEAAWPHLSSKDRFLRHAARVAIESQPVAQWADRVYHENDPQARITAAVALARSGDKSHRSRLLASLLELEPGELSESQFLGLLRAYALAFIRLGVPAQAERDAIIAKLDPHLPGESAELNTELLRVLVYLRAPDAVAKGMNLIASRGAPEVPDWTELASRNAGYGGTIQKMLENHPPSREIGYAFILRNQKNGWTIDRRRAYLGFLNEAAKGAGGASFPGFLANIREEALANCTDEERIALADVTGEDFNPVPDFEIVPPKGPGRVWTLEEALGKSGGKADFKRGRELFFATSCGACHRLGGLGGGVGPDLTSIPHKFDEAYLLEAIIDPSKDISDQYGSSIVTLNDGTMVAGLVVERGDEVDVYSTDPKAEPATLSHSDVKSIEPSPVSQMPPGLLNVLSPEELRDLVAYLMSGGDPDDKRFGKKK